MKGGNMNKFNVGDIVYSKDDKMMYIVLNVYYTVVGVHEYRYNLIRLKDNAKYYLMEEKEFSIYAKEVLVSANNQNSDN